MRLQPQRAWLNDRWRNLRGYTARDGTWRFVGAGSLALLLLGGVVIAGGVGRDAPSVASGTAPANGHSFRFNGWTDYQAPTTTTQAPPTTVAARVTRSRPPVVPTPRRGTTGGSGPCDRPSNCPQLRQCENGGSYGTHSNNGYTGAYQISGSTGRSVGMPANPTPAQQDAAADAIYARGGKGQWPVCGRFLR